MKVNVNSIHSTAIDLDDSCMRSRLAASIERARIAMTKLENIFNDKSGKFSLWPRKLALFRCSMRVTSTTNKYYLLEKFKSLLKRLPFSSTK